MYSFSFVSFFPDRWGTMVLTLHKDQSFLCPMTLLLKECMEIFCLYKIKMKNYLNFDQFIPAKKGCAFIS